MSRAEQTAREALPLLENELSATDGREDGVPDGLPLGARRDVEGVRFDGPPGAPASDSHASSTASHTSSTATSDAARASMITQRQQTAAAAFTSWICRWSTARTDWAPRRPRRVARRRRARPPPPGRRTARRSPPPAGDVRAVMARLLMGCGGESVSVPVLSTPQNTESTTSGGSGVNDPTEYA